MTTVAERRSRARRGESRDALWVDVPFTKAPAAASGAKGDLELNGYASTWGMDRDEEMVASDAFEKSLPAYLAKNPMLLWQHNPDWPIGSVTDASTDENGLFVKAAVPNPGPDAADWQKGAYTAIKNGVVRTFSIGGYFTRDAKAGPDGPVFYIVEVDLFEISCVSIPANADSIYEAAVKALGGESSTRITEKAAAQMEQLLGFQEISDPELRAMSDEERAERYDVLSGIFEDVHGVSPPGYDDFRRIEDARAAGVDPLKAASAISLLAKAFYTPEPGEKAGRAISAANREKLQSALADHDALEGEMVKAADAMRAAAEHHANSQATIKDVLGIADEEDEPVPDPDQDEEEDESSPEKGGDAEPEAAPEGDVKQLTYDLFARFSDAGRERFGTDDPESYCYVYVDDFDLDEGFVVYCVSSDGGYAYWQVPFTRDADGGVTLSAGQTEVAPKTGYVPKAAASPKALEVPEPEEKRADAKGALSAPSAAFAPRDTSWDASAAVSHVRTWAGVAGADDVPNAKAKRAFLWQDGDGSTWGDLKYPVADVIDGDFRVVFKGVTAAAGRAGSQGLDALKPALEKLYARAAKQFEDETIKPPWSED